MDTKDDAPDRLDAEGAEGFGAVRPLESSSIIAHSEGTVNSAPVSHGRLDLSTPLAAALGYRARGLSVLPIGRDKSPLVAWTRLQTRPSSPAEIRAWYEEHPSAGVGIVTGAVSGLVVLDADAPEALSDKHVPPTPTVRTSRGHHYFFAHPGNGRRVKSREIAEGLDVKADGGLVVAPPSVHPSGAVYEWVDGCSLDNLALAPCPDWLLAADEETQALRNAPPAPERIRELTRNVTLTSLAGSMRRRGMTPNEIAAALIEVNKRCDPPIGTPEVRRIAEGMGRYPAGPGIQPLSAFAATDYGNAERLCARHGQDLRWDRQRGVWLVFDGIGWIVDSGRLVEAKAKETIRELYREAADITDDGHRREIVRFARASESQTRLTAMVALARSEPGIPVETDDFDRDPWLLNCPNGSLNLRTGELREHRRTDLLTRTTAVPYNASATHPLWENLLDRVTGGDPTLRKYLQKAAGYSLTGDPSEDRVFLLVSDAGAGKSTFLEALRCALGDYASAVSADLFLEKLRGGGHSEEIANLRGVRLVTATEPSRRGTFAMSLLKLLSGGEAIRASRKYEHEVEFVPQFTPWIAGNFAPRADDRDTGAWRRIRKVPWRPIPDAERDPKVRPLLRDPEVGGPSVLAWAVAGCRMWQAEGLGDPPAVVGETQAYRQAQDPLGPFFEDCCTFGPERVAFAGDLRGRYEDWCRENGVRAVGNVDWGERLTARGCSRSRSETRRVWIGVGLCTDDRPDPTNSYE